MIPSAIQRSVVWLGATVWVAYLKKPDGANLLTTRSDAFGWLGGSLLVAGLAFHFWSNVSLARGETESAGGANVLVVRGPYRYVRNPIYLAGIPLLVGTCFLYSTLNSADLAAALVLMAFFHLRSFICGSSGLRSPRCDGVSAKATTSTAAEFHGGFRVWPIECEE